MCLGILGGRGGVECEVWLERALCVIAPLWLDQSRWANELGVVLRFVEEVRLGG